MEEDRFRQAFLTLKANHRIKAIDFARELGVTRAHVSNTITNNDKTQERHIPVRWFSQLCRHGVSAEWLLLGKGNMFNNQMTL